MRFFLSFFPNIFTLFVVLRVSFVMAHDECSTQHVSDMTAAVLGKRGTDAFASLANSFKNITAWDGLQKEHLEITDAAQVPDFFKLSLSQFTADFFINCMKKMKQICQECLAPANPTNPPPTDDECRDISPVLDAIKFELDAEERWEAIKSKFNEIFLWNGLQKVHLNASVVADVPSGIPSSLNASCFLKYMQKIKEYCPRCAGFSCINVEELGNLVADPNTFDRAGTIKSWLNNKTAWDDFVLEDLDAVDYDGVPFGFVYKTKDTADCFIQMMKGIKRYTCADISAIEEAAKAANTREESFQVMKLGLAQLLPDLGPLEPSYLGGTAIFFVEKIRLNSKLSDQCLHRYHSTLKKILGKKKSSIVFNEEEQQFCYDPVEKDTPMLCRGDGKEVLLPCFNTSVNACYPDGGACNEISSTQVGNENGKYKGRYCSKTYYGNFTDNGDLPTCAMTEKCELHKSPCNNMVNGRYVRPNYVIQVKCEGDTKQLIGMTVCERVTEEHNQKVCVQDDSDVLVFWLKKNA